MLKNSGLADVIREALGEDSVRLAFVFGSVARGIETSERDIDLMVIGPVSLRALVGRLAGVSGKVGREVNASVMSEAEFRKRCCTGDHFVSTVLAAPKLYVIGDADDLDAMGKERLRSSASK